MRVRTLLLVLALALGGSLVILSWPDAEPESEEERPERFEDATIFGLVEYLAANILLPISVFLIAIFAGWALSKKSTLEETGLADGLAYRIWRFLIRYVAPVAVAVTFIANLL